MRKGKHVAVRLNYVEAEDLTLLAQLQERTVSELLRLIIHNHLLEAKFLGYLEHPEERLPELIHNV